MSAQPEALRLAAELDAEIQRTVQLDMMHHNAAAELRRLHADAEESEALRERLSALLRNTAIALRGPEPELTRWSWHDLPDLAAALKAQRDALLEALRAIVHAATVHACHHALSVDGQQFYDIARAAIAKAEGKKT